MTWNHFKREIERKKKQQNREEKKEDRRGKMEKNIKPNMKEAVRN